MTNNKLTDVNIRKWKMKALRDALNPESNQQIKLYACALYEACELIQEIREVEGIYHLATLYEIDGVFTKDPCVLANARGRNVQGYVEIETANMFYKEDRE